MHPYTTQGKKSLNMRGVELVPKLKNYSRTKLLYYRVHMVIGHHNVSRYELYSCIFAELGITLNKTLAEFFRDKETRKG